jgi:tetratricopeptide (TPR) repeat protein
MTSDLQRWSREVAEDPGSSSFVRLARAYRRQGRHEAARSVVLGGLRANPEHVGGHALLALLHIEAGEREQARDEWETALRLDPASFDARRGLGYLALERGELDTARRHLDAAGRLRPDDATVEQALEVLTRREERGAAQSPATPAPVPTAPATPPPTNGRDPARVFASLTSEPPVLGAVLLDAHGLVLAGHVEGERGQGDLLGGLLSAAVGEAARAARILGLGRWAGMLLETEELSLRVDAVDNDTTVVVVTRPDTPAGWVRRAAGRARQLATEFLREAP